MRRNKRTGNENHRLEAPVVANSKLSRTTRVVHEPVQPRLLLIDSRFVSKSKTGLRRRWPDYTARLAAAAGRALVKLSAR
jgi:hypothetical protein